jgi:crotonobetainyl-CoA:carnitine CoA-transferase CaiB-like acyl-CoA transferase
MLPLEGLVVLDFAQYLAAPSAALRLADMGARVIKVERRQGGDANRRLVLANLTEDGDSVLFHTINRNKESYAVDLKDPADLARVKRLVARADVLIENFRPGTMERIGLSYEEAKTLNPRLVYASLTGYGPSQTWKTRPGQDLLIQSMSGIARLNGNADQPPMPFGLSMIDMMAGAQLVQGILALLVRRGVTGEGGRVEASLFEAAIDVQFEVLTTYLNDGRLPERSAVANGNVYLGAPYGIYATADGHIALAMGSILVLGELLECPALARYTDPRDWFDRRDEIKAILVDHLKTRPTGAWLEALARRDYWCAEVLGWDRLMELEGFREIDMLQVVSRPNGRQLKTTRCPIRIDGRILKSAASSPRLGSGNAAIEREFDLV